MADDDEFKRDLADARRVTFQAEMHRVQALTIDAVETLAVLMSPSTPPAVRLGAARTIAELAVHQHEADTIMRKLDEKPCAITEDTANVSQSPRRFRLQGNGLECSQRLRM